MESEAFYVREITEQALSVGDEAIGDRFEEIRHDEMKHRDGFRETLSKVAKNQVGSW
jgi:rubrerythrin